MVKGLINTIREKFTAKLVLLFTLVFFLAGAILAGFFIRHQALSCADNLMNNGKLLSEILAYNSRLGVFSENREQLEDIVTGLLRQENVKHVSVFNQDGALLIEKTILPVV